MIFIFYLHNIPQFVGQKLQKQYYNQLAAMQIKKTTLTSQLSQVQMAIKMKSKFPAISFNTTSKAIMSLSRRQGFARNLDYGSVQLSSELKPRRSIQPLKSLKQINSTQTSSNNCRQSYGSLSKMSKAMFFVQKLQSNKNTIYSKLPQRSQTQKQELQQKKQCCPVLTKQLSIGEDNPIFNDQSKFSQNILGLMHGYAACSLIGTLNSYQSNRLCIKNTTIKLGNKLKELSFFAIFEGRNGFAKAEFMKQNFYNSLISDDLFILNFEKAVSRTFQVLDKQFNYDPRFEGDYSIANCAMCVILSQKMYIIRCGLPNATISMNSGSYIKSMHIQTKQWNQNKKKSISSLTTYNSIKATSANQQVNVRLFDLNDNFDFLVLASEGVYHVANSNNQLGHNIWRCMLNEQLFNNNQFSGLGIRQVGGASRLSKVCNKICDQAARNDSFGRCMSIILIQLPNMYSCFEQSNQLDLPYSKNQKQLSPLKHQDSQQLQRQLTLKVLSTQQQVNQNKFQINSKYLKSLNMS